jgi:hypothetical protein
LVNLRESQNPTAPISTFGNGNPLSNSPPVSSTQYSNNAPAPPFHIHNINSIDMNTQNAAFFSSQLPSNAGLSSTGSQEFTPAGFAFHDGNEMDISGGDRSADQNSPATISSPSRGGSTSQSSYSPGQLNEHNLPYRASPKMPYSSVSGAASNSGTGFPGFTASEAFAASTLGTTNNMNMDNDALQSGFMMSNEWEYGALATGTGLTPMADVSWDAMLESVTMGWDSVGPTRNNDDHAPSAT